MSDALARPSFDVSVYTAEGLEAGLKRALLLLLRLLRGGRQAIAGRSLPMVEELFAALTALLETFGEVHLRVGVDGLSLGKEKVLEYSPRDDAALFRLFQNGVRQLSLHPGLSFEEVLALLDALTADLTALENVEEDVTTLLATKEFTSIHFVVVETFSESGSPLGEQDRRASDLAAIMAAAVRQTLSSLPEAAAGAKGGTIRFGAADVKFLEGANLPALIAALPKGKGADGATSLEDDVEIVALRSEIEGAMRRWLPWTTRAVVTALLSAEDTEAEALAAMLAREVLDEALEHGLAAAGREVARLAQWLQRVRESPRRETLRRAVFSPRLRAIALAALRGGDEVAAAAAVNVLRSVPDEHVASALSELASVPASPAREEAVLALMARGPVAVGAATELIASASADLALSILRAVANSPMSKDLLALHRAALSHREAVPRVHALAWFARFGGDHAVSVMGAALRDEDPRVRAAALYLVTDSRGAFGRALVRAWFDGPEFERLSMDEKRRGALVLARLGREAVLPHMRELMRKGNLTLRQRVDEMRAAAVAALGFLGDAESIEEIDKLARSRLSGPALQSEAAHVIEALAQNQLPYADPLDELREIVRVFDLPEPDVRPSMRPRRASQLPEVRAETRPSLVPLPWREEKDRSERAMVSSARVVDGEAAAPNPPRAPNAPATVDVVSELLAAYSFDEIPLMPLDAGKGGSP